MSNNIPAREFVLDYSLEEIKAAIETVITTVHNAGFTLTSKNDLLHSYNIRIDKVGDSGSMVIDLLKLEEKKTRLTIASVANISISGHTDSSSGYDKAPSVVAERQDYFLQLLTDVLLGKLDVNAELEKNKGCLGIAIILLASSLLAYFIL